MVKTKNGAAFVNGAEIRDDGGEMSFPEKELMFMVCGERPELPYPLQKLEMAWGKPEQEYVIPEADRQRVFDELCFFAKPPKLDDILFDLHEGKAFRVRDFRVIRWHGANLLASPYFPLSGGMLVDWVPLSGQSETTVADIAEKAVRNGK